jgi:hypothetical protein
MLSITTYLDEAEFQENSEMARDTGLMDVDAFDDLRDGVFAFAKELDDPEARGVGQAGCVTAPPIGSGEPCNQY